MGGWIAGQPEVVELSSVLSGGLAGGIELKIHTSKDTTEQLMKQQLALC